MASTLQDSTADNTHPPSVRPASPSPPRPPTLLTWQNLASTSSSPTSTSTSPSSSPILSPSAQAFDFHSPHSKSSWQLAQSEPAIAPIAPIAPIAFAGFGDDEIGGGTSIQFADIHSPKKETRKPRRRKTLHVDIPTNYIGHTREIEDEHPFPLPFPVPVVSLLDDDEAMDQEEEEDAVHERGRSRIRKSASHVVLGGSDASLNHAVLLSPPHIVCRAITEETCPNGTSCPYAHTHAPRKDEPEPELEAPRKERHPERTKEILALAEQVNAVTATLARLASTSAASPSTSTSTSASVSASTAPTNPASTSTNPASTSTSTNPASVSTNPASATSSPVVVVVTALKTSTSSSTNVSPPIRTPQRFGGGGTYTTYTTTTVEPLDELGLPPHPLMRTMDLAQYSRSGPTRKNSTGGRSRAGSTTSDAAAAGAGAGIGAVGLGAGVNGAGGNGAGGGSGGGRHSRRPSGSSSGGHGKFAVVGIPPFKASRRGSDASASAAAVAPSVAPSTAAGAPGPPNTAAVQAPVGVGEEGGLETETLDFMGEYNLPSDLEPRWFLKRSIMSPKAPQQPQQWSVGDQQANVVDDLFAEPSKPSLEGPPPAEEPTVLKRKAVVLEDLIDEPQKPSQELPVQPTILKRKAVVLEDPIAEPSKPSEFSAPPQYTIIKRQAVVLDDLQQPQPSVIKRPSTLLDDLLNTPPVPAQPTPTTTGGSLSPNTSILSSPPTSNLPPPALIYDSNGARVIGGYPTGEKIQLHSPPLSPEELRNPPRTTRYGRLIRPGGLFNNAVAGLSAEKKRDSAVVAEVVTTTANNSSTGFIVEGGKSTNKMGTSGGMFTKNQGMFAKGMFTLPMSAPLIPTSTTSTLEKESRRTSQSSRSSSNQNLPPMSSPTHDPVSPSHTSRTVDSNSNSSDRAPGSSTLSKMFTSPSRPLFSGYEHVVPTDAEGLPIDENLRRGAEEWLQRQREKDLRQALRLEKALDEKRAGLVRRLEWKAPLVETKKGYGYGDGLEVQLETKLASGEVYKVLTWEERFAMEKEVKRVEDSLVKVREDIVKHGGEPGQAISYVGTALAEARARARAIDEKNTKEREERAVKEREAMLAAGKNESPLETKDNANDATPPEDVPKPDQEDQGASPTSQNKGKGRGFFDFTFPTPQTPEHIIKAERERALIISKLQAGEKVEIPRTGSIDLISAYAANASPSELARLAQRVPPAVMLPETTAPARLSLPDHLKMPPSQRYESASPMAKEEKRPTVVKRAAVVLDEGEWSIDPPVTKTDSRPAPSGNGLLDLLTGATILGARPAKLTEQSMKRHEEMMAEDEKRRLEGVKHVNEPSQTKPDPPKASERMTSPPSRRPVPIKQSSQESGRSMWGRWGDSPLPGTAGALDGPGSPPFQFMAPRPASSVPPPEAIARPSSVAPPAAQLMSPSVFHAAKQERRISMSTAKPGEETSTQTMEALNLDDSDEDDNDETGDDSRDYVSAEEGEDSPAADEDDERPRSEEARTPENDDSSRPTLQRKRSSTTSGLRVVAPVPENRHRPSPLDDWHFDFASRKSQRDLVSPGPFSSAVSTSGASMFGGRATPTRHHHGRRRSSQENNQVTPLFGYGVAAPNNTPDSPPPRRYDPVSPTRSRPSNAERYTITRMETPTETTSQYSDDWEQRDTLEPTDAQTQAQHERPYFVVTRSANVLDEAANLIEYSTARVMSGGVKIGSILPRGVNGVIEEEDEDAAELEVDFETTTPVVPLAAPVVPSTTSPPLLGHQMTVPTYPLGVPVPGHPQAMSSTPLVPMSMAMGHQSQPTAHHVVHPPPAASVAQVQKRASLVLGAHGLHHAPHLSLPSPVTSNSGSQSQVAPVEYCGDFRTTGHCRFGARCRYSHDIEPRVRTSSSAAASRYRPSAAPSGPEPALSPQTAVVGIPPVPVGYQLSNVLPQPHHIPGIPLSQQPASPFVFAHPSSVAHPRTSPAATAAANRGVKMSNTEKATKILKSLGITPQQLLAHQPAPTVMADGEIMYDLTQGRRKEGVYLDQDPVNPFPTGLKLDRGMKEAHDMVLMRFGTEQEKRAVMGSSAGMVMDGEEEDIWTVTRGRKSQVPSEPGSSKEGQQRRRGSRPVEHEQPVPSHQYSHPQQYQQMDQDKRQSSQYYHQQDKDTRQPAPPQMRVPASYSPVQHLQYPNPKQFQAPSHALYSTHGALAQYQHPVQMAASVASVTPVTTPSPVPTASAGGGSLTQEEVIKVLTALGLSVPGLTTTPAHPTPPTAPQNLYSSAPAVQTPSSHGAQNSQRPRYPSGPYDYMHPSAHH